MNGNRGNIPNLAELQSYAVNRKGQYEGIRQSLFDFQTYAAAGQTSLTFFQVPIGQGGKTIADTNMDLSGSLAQPKHQLVESLEIYFYPLPISPASDGQIVSNVTTIAPSEFANDVYAVGRSGSARLFIGSKTYNEEAPLMRYPPKVCLKTEFAVALEFKQTVAADAEEQVTADYATFHGRPYFINPAVLLIPTQNFSVTLTWPTAVALPSGQDARIGVVLDGILYRQSQ